MGSTMMLTTSFLMKNEYKWSGPRDRFFTAEEYVRHYAHIMDMCDATTRIGMIFLPFAFKDDALEEFNMNFRDQVKPGVYRNASGDSLQLAFTKLKRKARKLQKTLGASYAEDGALCDFYRRSLQNESFWAYVDDSDPQLTSEIMHGKIELAIEKYSRINKSQRNMRPSEL
eukprot:IDg2178t1